MSQYVTISPAVRNQLAALKASRSARIVMYGDSTSTIQASGLAYIPRLAEGLSGVFGKIVGGSSWRPSNSAGGDQAKTARQMLTYLDRHPSITTVDGGSPSNLDVPLGQRKSTATDKTDPWYLRVYPNFDAPSSVYGDDDVPASLNGTRLAKNTTFNGKQIKVTMYVRSNTANSQRVVMRLRDLAESNDVNSGILTFASLNATTGDCVQATHTFTVSSDAYDDGFGVQLQSWDVAGEDMEIYGAGWQVVDEPGLDFVSWSEGGQLVRDIEDEAGDSDHVLASYDPDIVIIRFGPNEVAGSYAAELGNAMDWVHAAVPDALVCVMTSPFVPINSPFNASDATVVEMATHSAAMVSAVAARSAWAFGLDAYNYHADVNGINATVAASDSGTGLDDLFVDVDGTTYDGTHYKYGEDEGDGATIIGWGDADLLNIAAQAGGLLRSGVGPSIRSAIKSPFGVKL